MLDWMKITKLMEGRQRLTCIFCLIINIFRITPLKPPGGECNLVLGDRFDVVDGDDVGVAELKVSCKVTQPPGGSSKIFAAKDENNNNVKTPSPKTPAKPYRFIEIFYEFLMFYIFPAPG